MDQDSSFKDDIFFYINRVKDKLISDKIISSFGPKRNEKEKSGYTNRLITSGNILNIKGWKDVGKFDENLFIDEVDFDLCYKLKKLGKSIYKFEDVYLNHKVGSPKTIYIFGKKINSMNHNYIRKYYIVRNRMYMSKFYPQYKKMYIKSNILDTMKVILVEEDKIRKLYYMLKGFIDYRLERVGELEK